MCKLQKITAIDEQNSSPVKQDVHHLQRNDEETINKIVARLAQIGDQITEDYQSVDVAKDLEDSLSPRLGSLSKFCTKNLVHKFVKLAIDVASYESGPGIMQLHDN